MPLFDRVLAKVKPKKIEKTNCVLCSEPVVSNRKKYCNDCSEELRLFRSRLQKIRSAKGAYKTSRVPSEFEKMLSNELMKSIN